MIIRLMLWEAETRNGTELTNITSAMRVTWLRLVKKISGDLDVVRHDSLWLAANHFASNSGKVRAKSGMSVVDVFISYRAVF